MPSPIKWDDNGTYFLVLVWGINNTFKIGQVCCQEPENILHYIFYNYYYHRLYSSGLFYFLLYSRIFLYSANQGFNWIELNIEISCCPVFISNICHDLHCLRSQIPALSLANRQIQGEPLGPWSCTGTDISIWTACLLFLVSFTFLIFKVLFL